MSYYHPYRRQRSWHQRILSEDGVLWFAAFIAILFIGFAIYGSILEERECVERGGTMVQFDDDAASVCWTREMGRMPEIDND